MRKKTSAVIDLRNCWTMATPSLSRFPGPAGKSVCLPQCSTKTELLMCSLRFSI